MATPYHGPPLPPNFEMKIDPATGWPFFVDHATRTTSWHDPRYNYYGQAPYATQQPNQHLPNQQQYPQSTYPQSSYPQTYYPPPSSSSYPQSSYRQPSSYPFPYPPAQPNLYPPAQTKVATNQSEPRMQHSSPQQHIPPQPPYPPVQNQPQPVHPPSSASVTAPPAPPPAQPPAPLQTQPPAPPPAQPPAPPSTQPSANGTADPRDPRMQKINDIGSNLLTLQEEVSNFQGAKGCKEFLTLEEKLTRQILDLDAIDTGGDERIRAARKNTVEYIQSLLCALDNAATH